MFQRVRIHIFLDVRIHCDLDSKDKDFFLSFRPGANFLAIPGA